ncbi:MAG TPA: DUF4126 domain-containing protein [Terriglobales bacterium]|nr:DUF4126 domain-containing protein [Terriglobales bacterium]
MHFTPKDLFGLIAGTSFAAGLNLYATLATLGLLSRADVIALPPSLHLLESWWVIGASVALFGIEFFADKIPVFDLLWNALHTFIRVPVAALIAYQASAQLPPQYQIATAVAGGLIAFAAHGGKTAARAVITPSPEPVSNMALSVGEDVGAITLTWLATRHPYAAGVTVAVLILVVILSLKFVFKALRTLFRGAETRLEKSSGLS